MKIKNFDILHNRLWSIMSLIDRIVEELTICIVRITKHRPYDGWLCWINLLNKFVELKKLKFWYTVSSGLWVMDDFVKNLTILILLYEVSIVWLISIVIPSPRRSSYAFWLYGTLRPDVWNESTKRFIMRCLEDLRNWNNDETGHKWNSSLARMKEC